MWHNPELGAPGEWNRRGILGRFCYPKELQLSCPLCNQRKVKRFCPARGEKICAVCCGTEREVTIDCPMDCPHLLSSRNYGAGRREVDWSQVPFADVQIPHDFAQSHSPLLIALSAAIWDYVRAHREVVDADAVAALQALAESYRTLSSGIYYEKPPEYLYRRELYQALKAGIEQFKQSETERQGLTTTRDSDIRDVLIVFTQIGAARSNGRPKSRAFLDIIRVQLGAQPPAQTDSRIVLLS
jgi:hypothetical protein